MNAFAHEFCFYYQKTLSQHKGRKGFRSVPRTCESQFKKFFNTQQSSCPNHSPDYTSHWNNFQLSNTNSEGWGRWKVFNCSIQFELVTYASVLTQHLSPSSGLTNSKGLRFQKSSIKLLKFEAPTLKKNIKTIKNFCCCINFFKKLIFL